ncbi:SurA N-terminal domain-containing protein [Inmirania thermothiophila]|uniref:Periplasmic chaperone PpiD n=1 Tax=Inmirania thermothiophila TaxID=1750597 RepID=A0A3N1XZK5_9GAMM|nr:SurA N-terminal domain-containing protein [Inmirania thermothiophila]ROR31999.1 peptidyl-prolyl cis-trans isomerase D [Inmirania thermothiophila]
MLQWIRDRAQGWLAWIIVLFITVPFALWGVNQYFQAASRVVVAKVGEREILQAELERAYRAQRERLRETLGERFDELAPDEIALKRQVLDGLIEGEVLLQAAREAGMRLGDVQVAQFIASNPAFQRDGRFDRGRYEAFLARRGESAPAFEAGLRGALVREQLALAVQGTALVAAAEVDEALRLQLERRDLVLIRVPVARFAEAAEATEAEIARHYEAHKDRYREPRRVKAAYLELSVEALARDVQVSEEALRQAYEEGRDRFVTPEERHVRHILVAVPPDADEATEAAARSRIEAVRARIEAGEDFAEVAKEASEDPGSAPQGGDLGWIQQGIMDPAFEKAAFALPSGKVSEPVRSAFGWHLIEVLERRGGEGRPFEAVRETLAEELRRRQAEQRYFELADRLATLAYENPQSLEPAAEALGLAVKTTDWFSPEQGAGIAADARVRAAAFSAAVLEEGLNSDPLELAPDRMVVLRVIEQRPERVRPLEEVRDEVAAAVRAEKAAREAEALAERLRGRLAAGEDPQQVAAAQGLAVERRDGVGRDGGGLSPEVAEAAFRLPGPGAGAVSWGVVALGGGDRMVVGVARVQPGDPSAADAELRRRLREAIAEGRGRDELAGLVGRLRQQLGVRIFEENL